jgi:hypothetical protein
MTINGMIMRPLTNNLKSLLFPCAILVTAALCDTALAHHGFATIYNVADQVRISGTIDQVHMKNPHSEIKIAVETEAGAVVIWSCETTAKSVLLRKGITPDRLKPGDAIIIEGSRARNDPHECEIGTAYLADGTTLTLRSSAGRANIAVNDATAAADQDSVFGSWVRDSFAGIPVSKESRDSITEAGRAANAEYDGFTDDPSLDCRAANPVRAFAAPGLPVQFRTQGENLVIQHEFMDTTRVVYMNTETLPEGLARSEMGHSIGHFSDGSLVVETSQFTAGVLLTHVGNSGVLHSESMLLKETFHVNPDSGSLDYSWVATDAQFFGQPISGGLALAPTTLAIGSFDCESG